jgi:hypothetical protein
MMNDNSFDLAAKFADLVNDSVTLHDETSETATSLTMKPSITHSATYG